VLQFHENGRIWGLTSATFVLERAAGGLGGFVEVSLRPFADGSVTAPVGFIEGWYVDEDLRRQGWGRRLVAAAEDWARQQGCVEIASDCAIANHTSHQSHLRLGYRHADRTINFAKSLVSELPDERIVRDWLGLTPAPLQASAAVRFVTDPRAGGIDVFLGTTRAERSSNGQELVALDYEAYEEMANRQLRHLAEGARARWPIVKLALLHRTGRVALGEPSVIIAVSTPHRTDAFAACRWVIDSLKADVAIWKKEVWSDGSASWVHPSGSPAAPS